MSEKKPGFDPSKYVTVADRIQKFYEKWPDGRIITNIVEHDAERGFILMRAEVYRNADDTQPAATGHAYEYQSDGFVQRHSYIETGETSCVGRALAMAGFEVKPHIESREGMEKYERHQREGQSGNAGYGQSKPQKPTRPIAQNMSELVSPKQLTAIRAISNAAGLNAENECLAQLGCRPKETSRKAASWLIDWLKAGGSAAQADTTQAASLVERDAEGFNVTRADGGEVFRVWRNGDGQVVCNCPEFEERDQDDSRFRCSDIMEVKAYLDRQAAQTA